MASQAANQTGEINQRKARQRLSQFPRQPQVEPVNAFCIKNNNNKHLRCFCTFLHCKTKKKHMQGLQIIFDVLFVKPPTVASVSKTKQACFYRTCLTASVLLTVFLCSCLIFTRWCSDIKPNMRTEDPKSPKTLFSHTVVR